MKLKDHPALIDATFYALVVNIALLVGSLIAEGFDLVMSILSWTTLINCLIGLPVGIIGWKRLTGKLAILLIMALLLYATFVSIRPAPVSTSHGNMRRTLLCIR